MTVEDRADIETFVATARANGEKIDKLGDTTAKILTTVGIVERLTDDNHKALNGNGQPGIIGRVGSIETRLADSRQTTKTTIAIVGVLIALATACLFLYHAIG